MKSIRKFRPVIALGPLFLLLAGCVLFDPKDYVAFYEVHADLPDQTAIRDRMKILAHQLASQLDTSIETREDQGALIMNLWPKDAAPDNIVPHLMINCDYSQKTVFDVEIMELGNTEDDRIRHFKAVIEADLTADPALHWTFVRQRSALRI